MKRIEYWKTIDLRPPGYGAPCDFTLVPVTAVDQTHAFFDRIVAAVKAEGFSWRIYEDKLLEQSYDANWKPPG